MQLEFLQRLKRRFSGNPHPATLSNALAAALNDENRAPEFFRAFLDGTVHSIAYPDHRPDGPENVRLATFADAAGKAFIPFFSEEDLLPEELPPGALRIQNKGRELLKLARGIAPVVLNPGHARFKLFGIADVEAILDRLVARAQELATASGAPSAAISISTFTDEDWALIGRSRGH